MVDRVPALPVDVLATVWRARAEEIRRFAPAAAEAFQEAALQLERARRRKVVERITRQRDYRHRQGNNADPACAVCGWRSPLIRLGAGHEERLAGLESHHIVPIACGGPDEDENRILICSNCHAVSHVLWRRSGSEYRGPSTGIEFIAEMREATMDYPAYVESRLLLVMAEEGKR